MRNLIINCDGGSRGNPGKAGVGIVVRNENNEIIKEHCERIGVKTNNEAEYYALIKALELAGDYSGEEVLVYMDSELVIRQLNGEYKVKAEHLLSLFEEVKELERKFEKIGYKNVSREDKFQVIADRLVNEALDAG
ncbi:MAG: ribonuclease HI family protein [Nanoarchaeota archaeon]